MYAEMENAKYQDFSTCLWIQEGLNETKMQVS